MGGPKKFAKFEPVYLLCVSINDGRLSTAFILLISYFNGCGLRTAFCSLPISIEPFVMVGQIRLGTGLPSF